MSIMDAGIGSPGLTRRGLPKFREILQRPRGEIEMLNEPPDLDFLYDDSDKFTVEISELYSYTEEPEFKLNEECFLQSFGEHCNVNTTWSSVDQSVRRAFVLWLLDRLEVSDREKRMHAVRVILYLCQGVFGECASEDDQLRCSRSNVFLLYNAGTFSTFLELLNMEAQTDLSGGIHKPAFSIADSVDLRLILNVMYTMVETLRVEQPTDLDDWRNAQLMFRNDLAQPTFEGHNLAVILFDMVTQFCSGTAHHYPMKKVLLLLWKVVLLSVGGLNGFHAAKNALRAGMSLPALTEDTHEVCKTMRASSPPATASDLIEAQQPRRSFRSIKKDNYEDALDGGPEADDVGEDRDSDDDLPTTPPRPGSPMPAAKGLPWTPKIRQRDLEDFLERLRNKFVGFHVKDDSGSLAGLPQPIHEGIRVLKEHVYVSISEIQIKREEEIAKSPLSKAETNVPQTPAETLYSCLLPNLPQYMIALLKILLAAAPTSKTKTDSINILADVLPEEMPKMVLLSMKLGIDVNRHKEIIVKALAALLLLLLKHFKLNHVYQFEYMSQHLVFANCIPLVLKFFNQNISSYVTAKNTIFVLDFPSCVIGEPVQLTAKTLECGEAQLYCWRNLFSCVNMLRLLNKLTKWKHSRTMMLVVFKSAPILKRALKVRNAMMQLYILKLLKMQTKYLGRQWRKSNMKTMSAIYQKVRHRLTDDWAYGNDMNASPWDFQAEECALRACADRFNSRRYDANSNDPSDLQPVDNCLLSVLGQKVELSDEFKNNYEKWLDVEVFSTQIDWDQVLTH